MMSDSSFWNGELSPVLRAVDAGQCPVLVSGLGAASRAHFAAGLRRVLEMPLVVVSPDDSAAETFARDLEALLGIPVTLLLSREFAFYPADSAGHVAEQKRVAALDALSRGMAVVTVCTVAALTQRCIPPEALQRSAFTISAGQTSDPEAVERALLQ